MPPFSEPQPRDENAARDVRCTAAKDRQGDTAWAAKLVAPTRSRFKTACDVLTLSSHSLPFAPHARDRDDWRLKYKQLSLFTAQTIGAVTAVTGATLTGLVALATLDRVAAANFTAGASLLGLTVAMAGIAWGGWRLAKAALVKRQAIEQLRSGGPEHSL